jgi:hypothetical protein
MLATSNVCAWPCALLQPLRQFRRPAPCRLLKPVAAAAASATQQQGDVHSSSVMPVRDQDRLQLDVERKLGIPREIYDRVRGQKSPGAVCLCVLGGWARAAEGACLVALSWYAVLSTDIQARMLLQPIRLPLHGLLQAGGVRVRQHVNPLKKARAAAAAAARRAWAAQRGASHVHSRLPWRVRALAPALERALMCFSPPAGAASAHRPTRLGGRV